MIGTPVPSSSLTISSPVMPSSAMISARSELPCAATSTVLAAQHMRLHVVQIIGPDARAGVLQALAAGRRDVVGAAPDMHLLLAPFGAGVVLVEAGEVAIVALVERLVADGLQAGLADRVEDVLAGRPARATAPR